MNLRSLSFLCGALALGLSLGCGSAESDSGGAGGSGAAVGQGGAQDFGQFRAILEAGEVPHPSTLDAVGFFNEHSVEFPAADCGNDVCLHGQLGVMGNMITGSNCTLVLLGLNTPVNPAELERPPLNLAIAVDTSGSMGGENIAFLREGLFRMLDDLRPEDRVSLVGFSQEAELLVEHVEGTAPELADAISGLSANGSTNVYAGLRAAYEAVDGHAEDGLQNRVILLSDGDATAGITDDDRLVEMSRLYNAAGFGLSTIGVGTAFNPTLMRELSEAGAGAFYFLEDGAAVQEVFEEEVSAFLVPLATDVRIDIDIEGDYALRQIYGTKNVTHYGNEASLDIPTVQLAHRTGADDDAGGRRGGGGAIIAELTPVNGSAQPGRVGGLTMTYEVPGSDEVVAQEVPIMSALQPGDTPENGAFDSRGVEKSFVMLNIYAGFDMAATRASYGDDRGALGVLQPLAASVSTWLENEGDASVDPDIADDLRYIDLFIANLEARGAVGPPDQQNPPEIWPVD